MTDHKPRTIHLGQFRIIRLQVVNWGTFCGYKDFPIDERGVLFTGPSGSGKSSLMDAHSAALLPTTDHRFNASADVTARGAKQSTRSLADYVRGAWSETNDEHDHAHVQYLRGGKPTWSAVAATYDDGAGATTTAVVVKWFTGVENDGAALKTMHQIHDGHFNIAVLQEWAKKEFNTRWLKAAYPAKYPATQAEYLRELGQRIGLGSAKTGLSLLGKAKAMKNVGDLNLFIRDNMLDEPDTFEAAQRVVDAFAPLNDAYETASRANAQAQVLRDVPANWERYCDSGRTGSRARALLGAPMEHYLRGVHRRLVGAELDRLDKVIAEFDQQLQDQQAEQDRRYRTFMSLDEQWRREGGALQRLDADLRLARAEARASRESYRIYSGYVARLQRRCPTDEDTFTSLAQELPRILQAAQAEKAQLEPQRPVKFAEADRTRKEHAEKDQELTALRSARTLIPPRDARRREAIAQAAGIPLSTLPYAAELIDIAPGQERWRPAAEKVLRRFGLRMLVPEAHKDTVRAFVDQHDMRGIVEYSIVTATSAHRLAPEANTLAGKLTVDPDHPAGTWLAAQVAHRFNHVCVETARDLEDHRVAVTVRGTVKLHGNHYRKDDRPELTNPSSYILGANTVAKQEALQREVEQLAAATKAASDEAMELDRHFQNLTAMIDAAAQAATYENWTSLDRWSATSRIEEIEQRIAALKADNVDLQQLEQQRQDAENAYKTAGDDCATTRTAIEQHGKRQAQLTDCLEEMSRQPHTVSDDDDREYLDQILESLQVEAAVDTMPHVTTAFRAELLRRRDAAESERKLAFSRIKAAIDRFLESWPDTASDTSGDVECSGADFAALHEEIAHRRLPEAMTKFQQMISEDMVPSIGLLQRAIETASEQIQRRVDMVNTGLRRVEFNTGTHLQIAYRGSQPTEAKDFRSLVDTLLRHAPAAKNDPRASVAQFRRVRELMARFTTDTAEARRWRANVLDVRNSYSFYGRELDAYGTTIFTYHNTASNSGGEQEKLVAFCLAAALSYNLADDDSHGRPRFAPLMLDEAFSKSDETFAAQALAVFEEFGFELLIAAPIRMSGIVEPFIGQAVLVEKRMTPEGAHSHAAYATFGELAVRRNAETDGDVRAHT